MRILFLISGQSNEAGNSGSVVPTWGSALLTNVGGGGASGTYFRKMIELLARRHGHVAWMDNRAFGNTSLAYSHTGCCTNWSNRMIPAGAIILSGGGVWKQNNTIGTETQATTAPTGTANITLNGINWVYRGVPDTKDVAGTVYRLGDTNRFDPFGRIQGLRNAVAARGERYDKVIALLGFTSQKDSPDYSVTRAMMTAATQSWTDALLDAGVDHVGLGISYNVDPVNARYVADLVPAMSNALASYAGDSRVFKGPVLQYQSPNGIGVLPAAGQPGVPGLIDAGVHGNQASFRPAGEVWLNHLIAGVPELATTGW